jgi:fatty acid desaturase
MRRGRKLPSVFFHTLFVFCALTLIVALAFTGASIVAILSVVVAVISCFILPFLPSTPEPVFVRRLSSNRFPRAPPRN